MQETYQKLRETILNLDADVKKADAGNVTAGRRVRRGLKDAKDLIKQLKDASTQIVPVKETPVAAAPGLTPAA